MKVEDDIEEERKSEDPSIFSFADKKKNSKNKNN
jgi:hypothetical protein